MAFRLYMLKHVSFGSLYAKFEIPEPTATRSMVVYTGTMSKIKMGLKKALVRANTGVYSFFA